MDTIAMDKATELAREILSAALESTPQTSFGPLLTVLICILAYMFVRDWWTIRATNKRAEQDQAQRKAEFDAVEKRMAKRDAATAKREQEQDERAEQARIIASKAAIAEQDRREQARDRVIQEQRANRDDLSRKFSASLAPIIDRLGTVERNGSERDKQIAVLTTEVKNLEKSK